MLSWILKRTLKLFFIVGIFALGMVCVYYYSLVIEAMPSRPVNVPLGVRLKGSFYRRTLYQNTFNITSLSKADQRVRWFPKESERKLESPRVPREDKVLQSQPALNPPLRPRVKLDRYSEIPVLSSSVLEMIDGSEYLDERIVELSLTCQGVIFRDRYHAYGRCRNFSNMRFIDGSRIVAMPSFPGSGSTWARSALEQATGIYTGSIYCDNALKAMGFVGEKVVSANVLVVKTHYASQDLFIPLSEYRDPSKFRNITAAILLIRNPLDSIVSLWNWMHGGHTATTAPNTFGM